MKFSYVSNNCLSQIIYFSESREYDSPFIGSIFLNDYQYVKLCKNYNYYISLKPIFGEPRNNSIWCEQNNGPWYKHKEILPGYPVMFLDDIEIHWIHENNIDILLEKYFRRIERYKKNNLIPLFMLSISDLCNDHTNEEYLNLVTEFTNIENSLYLTKYQKDLSININIFLVKDWMFTSNQRNDSHIYELQSISNREKYFKDIIVNNLLNRDLKYSIIMPLKINELNSFKIFTEISLPLYDKFLQTEYLDSFLIICPSNNIEHISKYTNKYPHIPFKFVNEEYILDKNISNVNGWLKQQVIKLVVSSIVKTNHYLIVDSDMYLNQPFKYEDMYYEGKIKYSYEPWQELNNKYYSTNSNWWTSSSKILDYSLDKIYEDKKLMGVTPQIFIKDKVKELINLLEIIYGKHWQKIICDMNFTEYTLYWLFLLKNNNTHLYTIDGFPLWNHDLDNNILYYGTEEEHKTIVRNSVKKKVSYFSVIQSYLPVNIDVMKDIILKNIRTSYTAIFLVASMTCPNRYQALDRHDRRQQITDTLNSIKQKVPDSICILIEGTILNEYEIYEYNRHYDIVLQLGHDESILPYVNHTTNIGHGEMKLLEKGIDYLEKNILDKHDISYIFKLSSRYKLSDKFDLSNYVKDKYCFREHIDTSINDKVFTTCLYSIPVSEISDYKIIIIEGQNVLSNTCNMVERMYVEMIPNKKIHLLKDLGVEGILSYNKTYINR